MSAQSHQNEQLVAQPPPVQYQDQIHYQAYPTASTLLNHNQTGKAFSEGNPHMAVSGVPPSHPGNDNPAAPGPGQPRRAMSHRTSKTHQQFLDHQNNQKSMSDINRMSHYYSGPNEDNSNAPKLGMTISVPSVPGKTQRVLINKRQGAKPTASAARLFKKPLQSAGQQTASASKYGSSTTASVQGDPTRFTSFEDKTKSKMPAPFGSKDLRFNGKMELMEYFNKDPGPGSYSDEKQLTVESHMQETINRLQNKGEPIDQQFMNKERRFKMINDMHTVDPRMGAVGPASYDIQQYEKERQKHVGGPRIDYKGDFSLPFNEKNPLNYVKPITVNIYFKQTNPSVGQYDPQLVQKDKPGAKSKFDSHTQRGVITKRMKRQGETEPCPGQYYPNDGHFDNKEKEINQMTHQFIDPIPKKIMPVNLYDPHAPPEDEKNKRPEPTSYQMRRDFDQPRFAEDFEPRLEAQIPGGGKIYTDSNIDRFGLPIRPLKPINIIPGPGEYDVTEPVYDVLGPKPAIAKGGFIPEEPIDRSVKVNRSNPGPAFYNATQEPKKISFLFNPNEEWVENRATNK